MEKVNKKELENGHHTLIFYRVVVKKTCRGRRTLQVKKLSCSQKEQNGQSQNEQKKHNWFKMIWRKFVKQLKTVPKIVWSGIKIVLNIITMVVLVIGVVSLILLGMFSLYPREAHLNFSASEITSITIQASWITANTHADSMGITIPAKEDLDRRVLIEIAYPEYGSLLNHKPVEEGSYIVLEAGASDYPESFFFEGYSSEEPLGVCAQTLFKSEFFSAMERYEQDTTEISDVENVNILSRNSIEAFYGFNVRIDYDIHINTDGFATYLVHPDGSMEGLSEIIIETNEFDLVYINIFYPKCTISFSIDSNDANERIVEFSCRNVSALKGAGAASIDFSETPTSQHYDIKNQIFEFVKKGKGPEELQARMTLSQYSTLIEASGTVNEVKISNASLFPDIRKWFYSNIYLAPVSIASIVFGSATLLRKFGSKKE